MGRTFRFLRRSFCAALVASSTHPCKVEEPTWPLFVALFAVHARTLAVMTCGDSPLGTDDPNKVIVPKGMDAEVGRCIFLIIFDRKD